MTRSLRPALLGLFTLLAGPMTATDGRAADTAGAPLVDTHCGSCHTRQADGTPSRIGRVRQTPEGWDMTIHRMVVRYGVQLSEAQRHALVKYLADTRGLAPEEAAPHRYMLERRPNVVETYADPAIAENCPVCHSYARAALQGRDATEWLRVMHQHVAQFFTTEYQNGMRQRNWWEIVTTEMPQKLATQHPLESPAWSAWQKQPHATLDGTWRVAGHRPGTGPYAGTLRVTRLATDEYALRYDLTYAHGPTVSGTGTAVLYTGYEWRGTTRLGDERISEAYAVSADGHTLSGRWYLTDADEVGATLRAVRVRPGASAILAVDPPYVRAGSTVTLRIDGSGLTGAVDLGPGLTVAQTEVSGPDTVRALVSVATDAADGPRPVRVGTTTAPALLTVFRRVDSVRVEPPDAIARVGGGTLPVVTAQFEAVAYTNGADGKPATDDDVRIGVMPATWTVDNYDETARARRDVAYAGTIQPNGLFVPNVAGPNPERKYRTNNWGNLTVTGSIADGDRRVAGTSHLIVTIQRWVDAPIN